VFIFVLMKDPINDLTFDLPIPWIARSCLLYGFRRFASVHSRLDWPRSCEWAPEIISSHVHLTSNSKRCTRPRKLTPDQSSLPRPSGCDGRIFHFRRTLPVVLYTYEYGLSESFSFSLPLSSEATKTFTRLRVYRTRHFQLQLYSFSFSPPGFCRKRVFILT